jgi:hypothetical protein
MAQQLLRCGEQVALLAHFSAPLRFNPIDKPALEPPVPRLKRLLRAPAADIWGALCTRVAMRTYRVLFALGLRIPPRMRTMYIARTLFLAEARYAPKPYPGTLVLFFGNDPNNYQPYMGWNGLAEHFETHLIGQTEVASRREIMNEPLVPQLAAELTMCLDRAIKAGEVWQ